MTGFLIIVATVFGYFIGKANPTLQAERDGLYLYHNNGEKILVTTKLKAKA